AEWPVIVRSSFAVHGCSAPRQDARPVAEPRDVPDPHTGTATVVWRGIPPDLTRAVAGRLRGGVSITVPGGAVVGGQRLVRPLRRCAVGRDVMAVLAPMNVRALVAVGGNDIRCTYRDTLLVMIVLAPVIWTTVVAVLTS